MLRNRVKKTNIKYFFHQFTGTIFVGIPDKGWVMTKKNRSDTILFIQFYQIKVYK